MAHAGEVIEHPVLRYRATFIRTSADTNGEAVELEFTIDPGRILGCSSAEGV